MFSPLGVANFRLLLSRHLVADHPGEHPTARAWNTFRGADMTRNTTFIQKRPDEPPCYCGLICQAEALGTSGESCHVSQRTTGPENVTYLPKAGGNIHNQATGGYRALESVSGNPRKQADNGPVKGLVHVSLSLEHVLAGSLWVTFTRIMEIVN